ncbi:SDR family oxidoreductase [Hymenobacter lapidiphilus]|uniref:SDR family oxidoreductase n=1 Tax=Hymenobacter sp. CCM 8763 TaxID=2303334 RepID=UPI000E34387D|nr:SDR family oxidoreductase [Hymenobacter sp. CCM 8763]RFP63637.1 SDR family oxidoreductase [Hymenobacter sp. CCM 8763]
MTTLSSSAATGELAGKVALVTGASRGIGRAIALRLGRAGASVVVNYATSPDRAQEVVAALEAAGGRATAIQADISQPAEVARLFQQTEDFFGGLDIVVNNAGAYLSKPLVDVTAADFNHVFDLDTKGTFLALQEAARRVRDGGRIVNISSGQTAVPFPGGAVYAGSKAAAEQFGLVLAKELGSRQITVNNVLVGVTETESLVLPEALRQQLIYNTPLGRLGQPEDIAEVVGFLVSPAGRWMTGQNVRATGGLM